MTRAAPPNLEQTMKNNRILIFDTTLRDGEQCPGASMNLREKLEVARQLARLKVDIIEAGFPITSEGDFAAVHAIAKEIKGPVIAGLARCVPKDIEAAGAAVKPAGKHARMTLANVSTAGREITYVGERCNMVTCAACLASSGTSVIAVAPLPITTTRLPAYDTSSPQCCGCTIWPLKSRRPSKCGV